MRLKEEQEREKVREGGKTSEGADRRHPSRYITVRELEEELFKEAKEKERKGNGDGDGRGGESGDRAPVPPNYVSLRELQAQRLKEGKGKDQKGAKEKGDESGKIEKKINSKLCDRARNLRSKEAVKVCHLKSGRVWEPKLLLPADGSSTDVSLVEPMVSAENAGVSHEILTVSSDQNGKNKWKDEKKKKKKKNCKRDSGKVT